jgi:hypothetical protein
MRSWKLIFGIGIGGMALAGCLQAGTYQVTPTLRNGTTTAGVWHSSGGDACHWARRDSAGKVLGSNFSDAGPQYVEVAADDATFDTSGCVVWVQADGPFDFKRMPNSGGQIAGDGQYRVGAEIEAGVYTASKPLSCHWTRLSSFLGDAASVIETDFSGDFTVQADDVGLDVRDCGIVTRTGDVPPTTTTAAP